MPGTTAHFRELEAQKIVDTIEALHGRIEGRFPGSGLGNVVSELLTVSREAAARSLWIQRPHVPLRIAAGLLSLVVVAILVGLLLHIHEFRFDEYTSFIQSFDASISSMVFIAAAILFFVSWENRIKRSRALKAIHELRALAHIVDMHQLTKDPESYLNSAQSTKTLKRAMSAFELNRYLDYCSESLALISKIAALYVQGFQDPVLLDAVDDVEDLTSGFSRKIWQKLIVLENLSRAQPERN